MTPWLTYVRERSPLVPLVLMALGVGLSGEALGHHRPAVAPVAVSVLALLVFFLLARLMDEKKDYAKDKVAHPERPLPRGLLAVAQIERAIHVLVAACLALAVVFGVFFGVAAGALYAATIAFLWLMYREFYMGEALAEHPVVYAVSHQLVIFPLYAFAFDLASPEATFSKATAGYCLANLGANMAYEIARKLDPNAHPVLKTYLSVFGRGRTFALILFFLVVAGAGAVLLGLARVLLWVDLYVAVIALVAFLQPARFKWAEGASALGVLLHLWSIFAAFELGWT